MSKFLTFAQAIPGGARISLDNFPQLFDEPANAAFNKQIGVNDRTGDSLYGYFNSDGELFAWSNFMARTTNIGVMADFYGLAWRWRQISESPFRQEMVWFLVRPALASDLGV